MVLAVNYRFEIFQNAKKGNTFSYVIFDKHSRMVEQVDGFRSQHYCAKEAADVCDAYEDQLFLTQHFKSS